MYESVVFFLLWWTYLSHKFLVHDRIPLRTKSLLQESQEYRDDDTRLETFSEADEENYGLSDDDVSTDYTAIDALTWNSKHVDSHVVDLEASLEARHASRLEKHLTSD